MSSAGIVPAGRSTRSRGQAEVAVLGEDSSRCRRGSPGWSSPGTGPACRSAAPRASTFSAWIWKSVAPDTGPTGNMPLGLSKPSRLPWPPATSSAATSPRRSASSPEPRLGGGRVGAARPARRDRLESGGAGSADACSRRATSSSSRSMPAELLDAAPAARWRRGGPSRPGRAPAVCREGAAAGRSGMSVIANPLRILKPERQSVVGQLATPGGERADQHRRSPSCATCASGTPARGFTRSITSQRLVRR